jgi:type IV pilus assembly protein PilM
LDIAADRASLAVFERWRRDEFELLSVCTQAIDFGNGTNNAGYEQITQFLRAYPAELRRPKSIAVTLPAHVALTKAISIPAVPPGKRAKIVQFEASQAIPFSLEDLSWDWRVMAENTDTLDVCVTAIKSDVIRAALAAVAEAEMTVSRAIPASLAMFETFRRAHRDSVAPALAVCVDASATQLLYVCGERYAARSLALGWAAPPGECASDSVAINKFARRLSSEIARSLVYFQQQFSSECRADIYFADGGERSELEVALASCLECEIKRFDPLENLRISTRSRGQIATVNSGVMCSLVGAAAFADLVVEDGLNLLPAEERDCRAFQRRQPSLVLAAAVSAFALTPPAVHLAREQRVLARELQNREAELRDLRMARQRAISISERASAAAQNAERIQNIDRTRTAWMEFLADLESRLSSSGDIWIEQLTPLPSSDATATDSGRKDGLPLQLALAGKVVERSSNPEPASTATRQNAADQLKRLLTNLRASPFVAKVHDQRFEPDGGGALRFAIVVTLDAPTPL